MKLNKKQKEEFQHYAEKYAKELKNIFTYESSEKYLRLQAEYKWSAFCVENLVRYNVFGDEVSEDELIENQSLYRKYEGIVLPIFRQNVLELQNEKAEREKEERKRAKEESEKKDKQPRKKRKSK